MSKYTTEVRFICESKAGLLHSTGYNSVEEVIEKARPVIFNFDYPIFDMTYKKLLETKILKHYYTQEIGLETFGLWQLKLNTKLNEIMPYYNQLYKSELLKFDPFMDVSVKTEYNLKVKTDATNKKTDNVNQTSKSSGKETAQQEQTGKTTTDATDNKTDRYSETPQSSLSNIESDKYLTNARITSDDSNTVNSTTENGKTQSENTVTGENESTATQNATENINTLNDYISNVTGKRGADSYAKLLLEFRDTFLNIDMLLINELSDLFMMIY